MECSKVEMAIGKRIYDMPYALCAMLFFRTTNHESRFTLLMGMGFLFFALRLTIKNLSYILWCIAPQVKRSSNEVLLEP